MSTNSSHPVAQLGLTCPDGGNFHICSNSEIRFVGCCDTDPCADGSGSCPSSNLRRAAFDVAHYSEIPSQACANGTSNQEAHWYTCTAGPFMGCCAQNPCNNGGKCAASSLIPARLSDNGDSAAVFLAQPETETAQTTQTPEPTADPTSAFASPSATQTGQEPGLPPPGVEENRAPVSQIVGGTVGGAAAAILIACFLFLYIRRRRAAALDGDGDSESVKPPTMTNERVSATRPPWSPYKDTSANSPNPTQGTTSPVMQSPLIANDGRISAVSHPSSQGPAWDSQHGSYVMTGSSPEPSNYWTGSPRPLSPHQSYQQPPYGEVKPYIQQPLKYQQMEGPGAVSELEGSVVQHYHELDSGAGAQVPQSPRSETK